MRRVPHRILAPNRGRAPALRLGKGALCRYPEGRSSERTRHGG
ncbi:hypothetical protein [Oceaniglobus roseus]|nr:hypothetical protein [Kandeliimicrobium roseum]